MTYIDPFSHIVGIYWSKRTWMLGELGEYIGVEPDDGDQKNIGLTMSLFTSGLAVAGKRVFTLFFSGSPQQIYEHDIEAGTQSVYTSTPVIGFDDADDVCTDGQYLYCTGADTGNGSTTYFIAKFDLSTDTKVWTKEISTYGGGAIYSAANPGGIMVVPGTPSPGVANFFDVDGNLIGTDNTLINIIDYEWAVCATRDRFFLMQRDSFATGGTMQMRCYDNSGAIQYTIDVPVTPAELYARVSVSETFVFFWFSSLTPDDNARVVVCPRTVTRDSAGVIVSDVIDTASPVTYDLGVRIDNLRKATVDATTFTDY
jgi:hypothetical protein